MVFNDFLWNNFKESKNGQEIIEYFKNYQNNIFINNNIEEYKRILNIVTYDKRDLDNLSQYFKGINNFCNEFPKIMKQNNINNPENMEEAEKIFEIIMNLVEDEDNINTEIHI